MSEHRETGPKMDRPNTHAGAPEREAGPTPAYVHPDYLRHLMALEQRAIAAGWATATDWEAPVERTNDGERPVGTRHGWHVEEGEALRLVRDVMCFAVSYGLRHPITLEAHDRILAAFRSAPAASPATPDWEKWEPIVASLHTARFHFSGEKLEALEAAIREIERVHHKPSDTFYSDQLGKWGKL